MKSFLGLVNIAYTILLLVLLTKFTAADISFGQKYDKVEHDKIRRGANMGLYAFPRVGRSDPSLVNSLHDASDAAAYENIYGMGDASAEDFEDYQKRPGLVAFPRMGRSESELRKWAHLLALQQALDKRTGPSASSGLWFGPRLGKRSINEKDYPAAGKGQKEMY